MRTIQINKYEVENILNMIPNSAIITVKFEKKDHSVRILNGRRGVVKYLVPNPTRTVSKPDNIVTIYDLHKKEYRSFDINRVLEIHASKRIFKVII